MGLKPPADAITTFRDGYAFLSNFYPATVMLNGVRYRTVEHAFQAAKTMDRAQRYDIETAATPRDAKGMGKRVLLRPDWEEVKLEVMHMLLQQKFESPVLKAKLLATWPRELIEGNTWSDCFYGMDSRTWVGQNHLGRMLMAIRAQIRMREVGLPEEGGP